MTSIAMAAFLMLGLAAPAAAGFGPGSVRSLTLKNGLRVLLAPDSQAVAVDVAVWYRAGTRFERPGTSGISYLFGRLMFVGSRDYKPGEHRNRIVARGGSLNSVTNPDFTGFYQTLPADSFEVAIRLEADRMARLALDQTALDENRRAALEERSARFESSPIGLGLQKLYATAFEGHPYALPAFGADRDLERITLEDAREYYRERYSPQNAVLTVVGRFDPAAAAAVVRRHFEALPRRAAAPRPDPPPPPQQAERRASERGPGGPPVLLVGWRGPGGSAADGAALELLSRLVLGGRSSALARLGAEGPDGVLGLEGDFDRSAQASLLFCAATVAPGADEPGIEEAVISAVERLAREPAADEEIEAAKRRLEAERLFSLQTVRGLADALAEAEIVHGGHAAAWERIESIRRLTAADLGRVAAEVLTSSRRTVVWITAAADEEGGE